MDERLRELERRAATGDVEAQGALLNQRVQINDLEREQIELLAYLQYPPAWAALGWQHLKDSYQSGRGEYASFDRGSVVTYDVPLSLVSFAHGLRRWGREVCLRAGVAAALHKFPDWLKLYERCVREKLVHGLDMGLHSRGVVNCIVEAACCVYMDTERNASQAGATGAGCRASWSGLGVARALEPRFAIWLASYAFRGKQGALAEAIAHPRAAQDPVPLMKKSEAVRHAIRDHLVALIVEGRDPLLADAQAAGVLQRTAGQSSGVGGWPIIPAQEACSCVERSLLSEDE